MLASSRKKRTSRKGGKERSRKISFSGSNNLLYEKGRAARKTKFHLGVSGQSEKSQGRLRGEALL